MRRPELTPARSRSRRAHHADATRRRLIGGSRFNHRRLHGEIGHVPPVEYEAAYWAAHTVTSYRENPVPAEAGTN